MSIKNNIFNKMLNQLKVVINNDKAVKADDL